MSDLERARLTAEQAAIAQTEAHQRVADLRRARAAGGAGAPSAVEVSKARDAADLADDRLALANERLAEAQRVEAEAADAVAHEAERLRRDALIDGYEAAAAAFHAKVEDMAAELGAFMAIGRHLANEKGLSARLVDGAWAGALTAIAAAWPADLHCPIPRPIPFRDKAARAAWPQQQRALITSYLPPLQPRHAVQPAPAAAEPAETAPAPVLGRSLLAEGRRFRAATSDDEPAFQPSNLDSAA